MPRQNLPEAVAGLTPEQRAERRRQVLNAVGALASEPDFSRQMFRARVGGQLAALVARAGVSAAKLARKLNISPSQLSRQLAGDANLTLNSLHDIAGAAGATVRLQFESVHQFGAGLQDAVTQVRHDTSHMVGAHERQPMKHILEGIGALLAVLAWIAGTVLAPGWWKLAAFVFPPYPWYLVVERAMQALGLIACN